MQAAEWQFLAEQQICLNTYESALESFACALSLNPQLLGDWEGKVEILTQLQRFKVAKATLEKAIALHSSVLKINADFL